MYLYALRLVCIIMIGFVVILFLENNHEYAEFICDRYSALDYEDDSQSDELWEACIHRLRIVIWFVFLPFVAFQFHCIRALVKYRHNYENPDFEVQSDDV